MIGTQPWEPWPRAPLALSSRATISIRRSWDTTSLWPSPTRASNALPDWRRRLGLQIAAHDLALAAQRALGDQDDRIEQTRLAVADVLDGARAPDASEDELDAFIHQLRIDQCVLVSLITAAAWLAAERARLAQRAASCFRRRHGPRQPKSPTTAAHRSTSSPRSSRTRWAAACSCCKSAESS
jgi:hypothetical protein